LIIALLAARVKDMSGTAAVFAHSKLLCTPLVLIMPHKNKHLCAAIENRFFSLHKNQRFFSF